MTKYIMKWWPLLVIGMVALLLAAAVFVYFKHDGTMAVWDKQPSSQAEDLTKYEMMTVKVENDSFTPAHIEVKQGVPTKIDFKKLTNLTHIRSIVSHDLGMIVYLDKDDNYFTLDRSLKPGTYHFNCGMYMTYGTITVK